MKVITLINNKGGVGKTSSSVNLAYSMAYLGKKVLLLDLDPQGNASSIFSKIDYLELFKDKISLHKSSQYSMEDVLLGEVSIQEAVCKTTHSNLDYIPTYLTLAEAEGKMNIDLRSPQQYRLKNKLEVPEVKSYYDYVVIDCSPSLSILNINALVASTDVYIPIKTDGASVLGISMTLNLIRDVQKYQQDLEYKGCFFTMYNERKNISKEMKYFLEELFVQAKLLPLHIGVSRLIEEGSLYHKVLLECDPGVREAITRQYLALARYMIGGEVASE